MQSEFQTTSNNIFHRLCSQNVPIHPILESFATISIDTNITQSSLYKKYRWITSLKLISSEQYHSSINIHKHLNNQSAMKYLHIDKLLYLQVKFCEEGQPPITRIRTMKYLSLSDEDWVMLSYPKQSEGLYELFICFQIKQANQCKRIITDIQICSGRQLEGVGRGDQWQIAKIPQFSINYLNPSNQFRQKQRKTGTGSVGNIQINDSDDIHLQNKISDLSNKLQTSDLSINSYYSCEQRTSQKQSNQRQELSDRPPISPASLGRQSYEDNKKSSLTQFHSIQQQDSPLYFIMKTVDLFDNRNQFQYVYQAKKDSVSNIFLKNDAIDFRTLSNFCFPNGIKLSNKLEGFGYQIFNFILTSAEGERLYAYCLKFQQIMDSHNQAKLIRQLGDLGFIHSQKNMKKQELFAQKAFCLISRRCQTDFFYKILFHLYKVYLSFCRVSHIQYFPDSKSQSKDFNFFSHKMIKYLQNLQQNLMVKKINKKLNLQKKYQNYNKQHNIKLSWCDLNMQIPKYAHHPLSSKSLYCLLKCLSMDNIIKVIVCLLTDRKIFFVSNLQNVLGYTIQAFTNIIYPLKWDHVIIPIITYDIFQYLQAPMPIISGMKDEMVDEQTLSLTKGIYVFLDCNKLLMIDQIPQAPNHFQQCQKRLKNFSVYNAIHVEELLNYQQKAYSFDVHQIQQHNPEKTQKIKQIFFDTMVKLLKNYNLYFKKEEENVSSSKKIQHFEQNINKKPKQSISRESSQRPHKTFGQIYDCQGFINHHSKSSQVFYRQFCKSSCFASLIQNKFHEQLRNLQVILLDQAIENLNQNHSPKAYSCLSIVQNREKMPKVRMKKESFCQKDNKKQKFLAVTSKKSKQVITERGYHNQQFINYQHQQEKSLRNKHMSIQGFEFNPVIPAQKHPQRYSQGRNYTNSLRQEPQLQNDNPKSILFDQQIYNNRKTMGGNICTIVQNLKKKVSQSGSFVAVWTQAKVNRLKKYFKQQEKERKINRKKQDKYIDKLNKEMVREQSQFKITCQEGRASITEKKARQQFKE